MRHNVLFATAFATLVSTSTFAADLPGKGITVQPVQSTISEESFQTLLVSRALEKLGYEVEAVNDGLAAWQRLQQPDAPRLVILDWIMPGLEGIEEATGIDVAGCIIEHVAAAGVPARKRSRNADLTDS